MTCIIGMYCDKGNGAVIISDSRQTAGVDYIQGRKIYTIGDKVAYATSGLTGMANELRETVEKYIQVHGISEPEQIVNVFEDGIYGMYCHYKNPEAPRFSYEMPLLNAIIGIYSDGKPKLFSLYENGWAEPISDGFRASGDGQRYAHQILRPLYKNDMNVDQAIELGIHTIVQISKVDTVVDDIPQVATLTNDNIKLLNTNSKNDFLIPSPDLEEIKNKINGIEETRAKVFRLMLSDNEKIKNDFKDTINKFKD